MTISTTSGQEECSGWLPLYEAYPIKGMTWDKVAMCAVILSLTFTVRGLGMVVLGVYGIYKSLDTWLRVEERQKYQSIQLHNNSCLLSCWNQIFDKGNTTCIFRLSRVEFLLYN